MERGQAGIGGVFGGIYGGKRVLVTGHTGFKGAWLTFWLHRLGAEVRGIALEPEEERSLFADGKLDGLCAHRTLDVRDGEEVRSAVEEWKPEAVFHLAAQALVRRSYATPAETFDTNVMGTVNVLEAVRRAGNPCAVVVVTSDKCYENLETERPYEETDRMGGHDPYSASKGCAELAAAAYRASFFAPGGKVRMATARAGNVIGPGDWAEDRIVPDAVRALAAGRALGVRNPKSVRPWQHVLEPLSGYLRLGQALMEEGASAAEGWNFGPEPDDVHTVGELAEAFCAAWGDGARWQAAAEPSGPHEAGLLRLAIGKAEARLGWKPAWDFGTTVRRTAAGYRRLLAAAGSAAVRAFMEEEIAAYEAARGGN
jgi:CDP-glucose 4,6-dehydratase